MRVEDGHVEAVTDRTRTLCILEGTEPEAALSLISVLRRSGLRVPVWYVGGVLEVEGHDQELQQVLDEHSIASVCRWPADRPRAFHSPFARANEPHVARILKVWEAGLTKPPVEDAADGECAAPYVHLEVPFLVGGLGGLPASETILEAVGLYHQEGNEMLDKGLPPALDPDVARVLQLLLDADATAGFDEAIFDPSFDEAIPLFPCRRKLHGTIAIMLAVVRGERGFETGTPDQMVADVLAGMRWLVRHHPTGDLTFAVAMHDVAIAFRDPLQPNQDEWLMPARREICREVAHATFEAYIDELKDRAQASERLSVWVTSCRSKHFARAIGRDIILAERQARSRLGSIAHWGGHGRARLPLIAVHELLHPFGALDEYAVTTPGHGYPSYLTRSHELPSGNAELGGGESSRHRPCVMNGFADHLCVYTLAHIGWVRALLVLEAGGECSACSLAVVAGAEPIVLDDTTSLTRPGERQAFALDLPATWTPKQGLELVARDPQNRWWPAVIELWIDDFRVEQLQSKHAQPTEGATWPRGARSWKLV